MKQSSNAFRMLAGATLVACLAGMAFAQDAAPDTMPAKPMYGHLPPHVSADVAVPATHLQIFVGSYTYRAHKYSYDMVGTAPSTGTSTTVPVYIIPIKMVYVGKTTTTTFDPQHKLTNGLTVVQNTVASPIFQAGIDFNQQGIDLGNTQYIDAFQRGNFWNTVKTHTGWHTLLGKPTVEPEQTLTVPAADGSVGNEFGVKVGLADINWFDTQITAMITKFKIQPNALPIFLTYDTYLTQGGCCIGGYHSASGSVSAPQTYSHFTYIDKVGAFAQDVTALSHEIGEWADDPYVGIDGHNNTPCGILEVGDPLEGNANYGGYPYTLNGFTYNLQDMVWLPYFGAPPITSAHGWSTFQGEAITVCQNGA